MVQDWNLCAAIQNFSFDKDDDAFPQYLPITLHAVFFFKTFLEIYNIMVEIVNISRRLFGDRKFAELCTLLL